MKTNKFLLIITISLLIAASTFIVAAAQDTEPPILSPDCGTYTDTRGGTGNFGNYSVVGSVNEDSYIITSSNGWQIVEASWLDEDRDTLITYNFPPGTTSETVEYANGAGYLSVTLKKNCSCRLTGRYVYTLLGNYPCNLISEDSSIPARFLDPEYTAPLCNLPNLGHIWNGDWVKSEERDCGGYFTGGNHYDTSLGNLP